MRGCLASLSNQSRRPEEVIVIDNAAPGEQTTERVLRHCRGVVVIQEKPGIVGARNRGYQAASGALVAYLDDDCRPPPDWLAAVCRAFAETPQLGCCTGPLLPQTVETQAQQLMEKRGGYRRGEARADFSTATARPVQAWRFGSGGNMSFRREVLEQLGGFDPRLPIGEDLDILYRVIRHGWQLRYEPAAWAWHRHLRDDDELRTRLHRWGRAYAAFLTKVALTDPAYRGQALQEWAGTLGYHWRERLWPALWRRDDFPVFLILIEMLGLLIGGFDYLSGRIR